MLAGVIAKILYVDMVLGLDQGTLPYVVATAILGFCLYLFFKKMGLFKITSFTGPIVDYGKVWGALGLSFLIMLGILYLFKVADFYSRGWLLCWLGLSAIALVLLRSMVAKTVAQLIDSGRLRQRVSLIGTPAMLGVIKEKIQRDCPHSEIGGVYSMDVTASDSREAFNALEALRDDLRSGSCERVIVALPADDHERICSVVRVVSSYSTEALLCTDLARFPLPTYGSQALGGLRMEVISAVPAWEHDRLLKYTLDYTVAALGLLVLAPLFAVVAIAIKLDSPGPVFFRQRRYGHNNRVFRIFKFRTMSVTEDGTIVTQAVRNDPRVTRIGRVLRATSIDELPQLINVLLGEMSIVGPRPHPLAYDDRYDRELDLFSRRRRVLPGITGWAQVNGYRGETKELEDVRRRMEYDFYYIENWSIWLDIEIMARTVLTVLRGAY